MRQKILALVLAAGKGGRMGPLTEHRAKPNLPFAGTYHLIDFPLTNCRHSEINNVWVVQQHNPHGLTEHLANGRPWDLDRTFGGFRTLHPFTGGGSEGFLEGNAQALWAHIEYIEEFDPDVVLVLSADHVYRCDYRDAIDAHLARNADVTVVTSEIPREEASRHGVVERDGDRITRFLYKPDEPPTGEVATEIFVYTASKLTETLRDIVENKGEDALGDFGDELLPRLVDTGNAWAHRLDGYWRDVGTIDAYWTGHQDLLGPEPKFQLDDPELPLMGEVMKMTPAHFLAGAAPVDSLISTGCIVAGRVERSVLGTGTVVEEGATVVDSVLMEGVVVRPGATVTRAIVAADCIIGKNATVGVPEGDLTVLGADHHVSDGSSVDPGNDDLDDS